MPVGLKKRGDKWCVVEPDGTPIDDSACYADKADALARQRAINANIKKGEMWIWESEDLTLKDRIENLIADNIKQDRPMKTEGGKKFPPGDYACVPDRSKPSTWQLRMTESPGAGPTKAQLGRAAAAFSPGGHRGNKVQLKCPASSAKGKIRAAYRKLGVKPEEMPDSIKEAAPSFSVFKDHDGLWNWLVAVSNNIQDRDEEILTSDGHRYFVNAIDTGLYKEAMGHDMPQAWVWHLPVPVGEADMVAYDERGFLIAAGKGYKGEFYDKVYEGLARMEAENPGSIGMSHGMPNEFLIRDKGVQAHIIGYMSKEFTFLPVDWASNTGTGVGAFVMKQANDSLQIPAHKQEWFLDVFGEEVVEEFSNRLAMIGEMADETNSPRKEKKVMTDSTDKDNLQEETVAGEALEDTAETVEDGTADVDQEQDTDDSPDAGDDVAFVTLEDMREIVDQVITGVSKPFKSVNEQIVALTGQVNALTKQVNALKQESAKAKDTPIASLSSMIASSIIGQEKARTDDNTERQLNRAEPEAPADATPGKTGIPSIDALIKEQRGNRRVTSLNGLFGQKLED